MLFLTERTGDSDLLTVYNAYCGWRRVCQTLGSSEQQFCRKNFLSSQTLANIEDLKVQLLVCMVDAGFLPLEEAEGNSLQRQVQSPVDANISANHMGSARFATRQRHFFIIPKSADVNNDNDLVAKSVIAWAFYPKLLARDGKGWRNIANNQSVSLHPSSVNKGQTTLRWLSFYHIMQSASKSVKSTVPMRSVC